MFVCGPTVYDYSHLGHARTFIFYDMLARFLRRVGYRVFYIMNITDVDDKILNRAKEEGISPLEVSSKYEKFFLEDMESLNITSVNLYARASDYLPEIFDQIEVLLKKGYAYETETGVYFDISRFKNYGKLSGRKIGELIVHRIEPDPTKRNPGDFALWKKRPLDEWGWESPWGHGRPGWHIEDTAITLKHFGKQYDIHGGAIELLFPHHEAEVAQAEAYTGITPFVKYWIHTGILTVGGEKMSKSLGNYVSIRDALKKYSGGVIRLYLLSGYYRSPLDFKWEGLEQASRNVTRLKKAFMNIVSAEEASEEAPGERELLLRITDARERFFNMLADDLRTPNAIAALLEAASHVNKYFIESSQISAEGRVIVENALRDMSDVLGITPFVMEEQTVDRGLLEGLIDTVLYVREIFRKRREWSVADEIRERLRALGVEVHDTPSGPRWYLAKGE